MGKTSLLRNFLDNTKEKYRLDTGRNVFIQEISNIGRALKIIVDQIPNIKGIATGSSAFKLSQNIGKPLTSKKRTLKLFLYLKKN